MTTIELGAIGEFERSIPTLATLAYLAVRSKVGELIDRRLRDEENPSVPITDMWSRFDGEAWSASAVRWHERAPGVGAADG